MKPLRFRLLPLLLALPPAACGGATALDSGGESEIATTSAALSAPRGNAGDLIADVEVGRRDFTEITTREIFPDKINNPGGVVVDKSVSPGRAYVWDSGNNRILGVDLATCYATASGTRCPSQLIFGQPSGSDHGACNLDASAQQYPQRPPSSASTLCGIRETTFTVLEDKSFANMFVDSTGNLWVPDALNNRVLKYNTPFSTDTVADGVWGQANFTGNGCNRAADWLTIPGPTASSLCFWDPNGAGTGSGVRLDAAGNLWVADGGNNRVLRFPKSGGVISQTADIVLGQGASFTSRTAGTGLNQMSSPTALVFDASGKLYVTDSGNHRVLVFNTPLSSGQTASTLGTFPADVYGPQTLELDPDGRGFWTTRFGDPPNFYSSLAQLWNFSGQPVAGVPPIYISWNSGGSIGFDAQKRMLVSSYVYGQDVERFTPQPDGSYLRDKSFYTPPALSNITTARRFEAPGFPGVGVADKVSNPKQLIATDSRLMFWNNPSAVTLGQAPDGCVGGDCTTVPGPGLPPPASYGQVKVDASDRVWVSKMYEVDVFQAPLSAGSIASKVLSNIPVLGGGNLTFNWVQNGDIVTDTLVQGLAPSPDGQYLWISQPGQHRVVRVKNPLTSPVVDVILGQATLAGAGCNRGGAATLSTLCFPGAISLDKNGNLFVSDHTIELEGNQRLLMFAAATFPANPGSVLYGPAATKEFPASSGMATFEPAFDSTNRMVIGFNPYTGQRHVQYFNNPTAFNPSNRSDPAFAVSSGQLEDFYNWPVAATFDSSSNLYVYDANRGRVNIYKTPFGAPPPPPPTSIRGQYKNNDVAAPNDNQIKPNFNLVNTTASAIPLSEVKVRYYFSSESANPALENFYVDYAAIGNSLVHGSFTTVSCGTTNAYVEVSFSGGTLAANGQTGEIQTRFSKTDFSAYTEGNDYSYLNQSTFADSSTITVYRNGTRVWGTPPSGCN